MVAGDVGVGAENPLFLMAGPFCFPTGTPDLNARLPVVVAERTFQLALDAQHLVVVAAHRDLLQPNMLGAGGGGR